MNHYLLVNANDAEQALDHARDDRDTAAWRIQYYSIMGTEGIHSVQACEREVARLGDVIRSLECAAVRQVVAS